MSVSIPQITDLEPDEMRTLDQLVKQWRSKLVRNELRSTYYNMKNVIKDLEISIPPHMRDVETVFGWAAKSVDMLANRCRIDGFTLADGDVADFGIDEIVRDNRVRVEAPQAHTSAFIHAMSFLTTTKGDTSVGEPDVLVTARSARTATGIWSPRLRRLTSALAITNSDVYGISEMTMYMQDRVVTMRRQELAKWVIVRSPHSLGRVPVEPLVYRPNLDRPFGQSRISRAVMSIVDSAVRTALRTEVSAEFFAAPQRYILGADEDAFVRGDGSTVSGWESVIGRMLAMGRDENGDLPVVGSFSQQSMEPHLAQLRQLATRFAGETNIPISALGVVHDANPASAEAKEVDADDLIADAEWAQDVFGNAWVQTMRNAVRMRDGLSEDADLGPLDGLEVHWRPAKAASRAAAADAAMKFVSAFPWLAETEVALEMAGLSGPIRDRAMAEKRKAGVSQLVASMVNRQAQPQQPADGSEPTGQGSDAKPSATEDAAALKAKFEALGMAVRAGVDPADAASRLGLSGVKFTGGIPVSLRMPGEGTGGDAG